MLLSWEVGAQRVQSLHSRKGSQVKSGGICVPVWPWQAEKYRLGTMGSWEGVLITASSAWLRKPCLLEHSSGRLLEEEKDDDDVRGLWLW